jgi:molybdate transport system ATP-binding protein
MLDIQVIKQQGGFQLDVAFKTTNTGITVLFGPSGAGKTSVINMVAGLTRPDCGRIVVQDRLLFDSEHGVDLPPEKRSIGYIFQDGRLFPHLTVHGNLTYGMKLTPARQRYVEFDQVVDLLGIAHLIDRRPARLSGGEKQRVAIGRALLTSPRLLLMDEPLASLDLARKSELMPFIAKLPAAVSIPIIYVTHSVGELMQLADNLVLLKSGKSAAVGRMPEAIQSPDFQDAIGRQEAFSVVSMIVKHHDTSAGLTLLQGTATTLRVPLMRSATGAAVRLRIRARDVAIALEPPSMTSFQNILKGNIERLEVVDNFLVDVSLNVGFALLARVTIQAKNGLGLKVGQNVYALIKSMSISAGTLEDSSFSPASPAGAPDD